MERQTRNGESIVDNTDLALSLTDAAGAINASPTFEGALKTVARLASTVVPDIDHVGVMLTGRRGRIRGEVATGALARDLDRLQIASRAMGRACAPWSRTESWSWSASSTSAGGRSSRSLPQGAECAPSSLSDSMWTSRPTVR
jgi:hypothetical protein